MKTALLSDVNITIYHDNNADSFSRAKRYKNIWNKVKDEVLDIKFLAMESFVIINNLGKYMLLPINDDLRFTIRTKGHNRGEYTSISYSNIGENIHRNAIFSGLWLLYARLHCPN
jgi:hypothetical protein